MAVTAVICAAQEQEDLKRLALDIDYYVCNFCGDEFVHPNHVCILCRD